MNFRCGLVSALLSAASLGLASPSVGQIQEITVTARKVSESLQSTPVAVTALSEQMLIDAQIDDIGELKRAAPGLTIGDTGSGPSTLVFIAIRGQAQVSPDSASDPSVATYIDGVYYARPTSGNLDLLDVSRAEVLRGPQGTLFGRSTTGGALNIITNDPTGQYEGWIQAGAGNYNSRKIQAVANLPINGEVLATRFAFRYSDHNAYGDYPLLDRDPMEVEHNYFGRAKVRWAPENQPFSLAVSADYSEYEDTGLLAGVEAINSDFSVGVPVGTLFQLSGLNPDTFIQNSSNFRDYFWTMEKNIDDQDLATPKNVNESKGLSATLEWDFGNVQLKSITAWRDVDTRAAMDLDGTPLSMVTFSSTYQQDQRSQEFQLTGAIGNKFDWITGLYYFQEDSFEQSRARSFGVFEDLGFVDNIPVALGTKAEFESTSAAVFGQLNYQFNERLRGTLGLRYTRDDRDIFSQGLAVEGDPSTCIVDKDIPGGPCEQTRRVDFEYPAWVVSLDYQYSDNLFLYAKTSGASMSGGWNIRGNFFPAFEPEDVMDVEVGFKADLLDNTVRVNGAFFHAWQRDVQRLQNGFDPAIQSVTSFVQNAGNAKVYGAEFELTWLPWEGMEVTSNLSLLEGKYEDGSFTEPQIINGQTFIVDRSGEELPQLPEVTFNIGATQVFQLPIGEASVHVDYFYIDERSFYDETIADAASPALKEQSAIASDLGVLDGYTLINARATMKFDMTNLELSIWGKNITNEEYSTNMGNFYTAFGTTQYTNGFPRTYGASVKYTW